MLKLKNKKSYLLLVLTIWCFNVLANKQQYVILSSGQDGGSYYNAGEFIKNTLNPHLKNIQIVNIYSEGSYQNFERLDKRACDLIIAQRNVLIEKYYAADNPIRNVEVVMPLFSESFQIIVHSSKKVIRFDEFKEMIDNNLIKGIAIGKTGSASNVTAREVFNLLGVKLSDEMLMQESSQIQLEAFNKDKIDALIYFAAVPIKKLVGTANLGIVTFNENELTKLTSYFKDFNISKFNVNLYNKDTTATINTLGTDAFLVCNYDMKNILGPETYSKIPLWIINSSLNNDSSIAFDIKENYSVGKFKLKKKKWEISQAIDYNLFFSGIPFHSFIAKIVGDKNINIDFIIFVFIIIIFLTICIYVFFPSRQLKKLRFKNKYGHILIILLFYIILTVVFVYFIHLFEKINYLKYGVKGSIMNLTKFDTLKWLIVFIFTGYEDEIFPISTGAKIMTTLSFFLAPATLIITFAWQYLTNNRLKKISMGEIKILDKDHDVICGWNMKTADLIEKLYNQNSASGFENRKIVLLNEQLKCIDNLSENIRVLIERDIVRYVNGDPTDIEMLKGIRIQDAHSVIIVNQGYEKIHDENVLLIAYAISTYCKELKGNHLSNIYMMAEITNPVYINKLKAADVNVVICSGDLINSLMIQSIHCEGIYNPIKSLIDYGEGNDFYMIHCKDYPVTLDKNYDELLMLLRKFRIQLIGIKTNFLNEVKQVIIDDDLIKLKLREKRIANMREVITDSLLSYLPAAIQERLALELVDLCETNKLNDLSNIDEAIVQKSIINNLPDDLKKLIPIKFSQYIRDATGFSSQYLINPQCKTECAYKTQNEDELILLALDNKSLNMISASNLKG